MSARIGRPLLSSILNTRSNTKRLLPGQHHKLQYGQIRYFYNKREIPSLPSLDENLNNNVVHKLLLTNVNGNIKMNESNSNHHSSSTTNIKKTSSVSKSNSSLYLSLLMAVATIMFFLREKHALANPDEETSKLIDQAIRNLCIMEVDFKERDAVQNILNQTQDAIDKLISRHPELKGFSINNFVNDEDVLSAQAKILENLCKGNPNCEALFNLCRADIHYANTSDSLKMLSVVEKDEETAKIILNRTLKKLALANRYYELALEKNADINIKANINYQLANIHLEKAKLYERFPVFLNFNQLNKRAALSLAAKKLNEALNLTPENSRIYAKLGDVHLISNNVKIAIDNYEKSLKFASTNRQKTFALIKLAQLNYKLNNYDVAIEYLKKMNLSFVEKSEIFQYNFILGLAHFQKGLFHEAIENLEKALELNRDPQAVWKLADAYIKTNQFDKAIDSYDEVLKSEGVIDKNIIYHNRAIAFVSLGRYNEAFKDLELVLKQNLDPSKKYQVIVTLANVHYIQGNFTKALELFDEAIVLDSANELAFYGKARILTKLAEDETIAAKKIDLIDKAKAVNPDLGTKIETKLNVEVSSIEYDPEVEEQQLIESFSVAFQSSKVEEFQKALKNRKAFTREHLDKLLSACQKEFEVDFESREKNPDRIDKVIDKLLSLELFVDKSKGLSSPMSYLRDKFQFKYEQHLNHGAGIYAPEGFKATKIKEGDQEKLVYILDSKLAVLGEGFSPLVFLSLRIRSLVSVLVRLEKDVLHVDDLLPKDDKSLQTDLTKRAKVLSETKAKMIEKIKKELLCEIETFRNARDATCIRVIHEKTKYSEEALLEPHIENLKTKISNLNEGEELSYYTGHDQHAICANFLKTPTGIQVRIDNLGDGIGILSEDGYYAGPRHLMKKEQDQMLVFPCLMSHFGSNSLEQYLKNIYKAQNTKAYLSNGLPDLNYKWTWIYPNKCEPTGPYAHWQPDKPQTVGNCVAQSHNVGVKIRMDDRHFQWMLEKEKTMAGKLRDNPDYFMSGNAIQAMAAKAKA